MNKNLLALIYYLPLIVLVFPGCSHSNYNGSMGVEQLTLVAKNKNINSLAILPVIAEINLVDNKNELDYNPDLSDYAIEQIKLHYKKCIPDSVATEQIAYSANVDTPSFYNAVEGIVSAMKSYKNLNDVAIPAELLELLAPAKSNYGLCIVSAGFTRTARNYKKQYIKLREANVLSLGLYNMIPIQSYSLMICFIIDKSSKKLVYYKRVLSKERDPSESAVLKSQLYDAMMSYYQNR